MTKAIRTVYTQRSWCFLRTSEKLRGTINFRIEQLGLKQGEIAKAIGVRQARLSSYLNSMDVPMTQYQTIKLCKFLGIKVELMVSLDESIHPQPKALEEIYLKSTL